MVSDRTADDRCARYVVSASFCFILIDLCQTFKVSSDALAPVPDASSSSGLDDSHAAGPRPSLIHRFAYCYIPLACCGNRSLHTCLLSNRGELTRR